MPLDFLRTFFHDARYGQARCDTEEDHMPIGSVGGGATGPGGSDRNAFSKLCRRVRKNLGLSIAALALRARVSNQSIAKLESTNALKILTGELEGRESERKRRAWGRVVAQVAIALGQKPEEWI